MKKITLVAITICSLLALIYFVSRDTTEKKESRIQAPRTESKDKSRDEKVYVEEKKEIKGPLKEQSSKKIKDQKANIPKYQRVDEETAKQISKIILKRNKHFKNSEIEVISSDNKNKRSSVVIKSLHQGKRYSFSALVDNNSGKILKTWGRTIIEKR